MSEARGQTATRDLYDAAARLLPWMLDGVVDNAEVRPRWIGETDRFYYRRSNGARSWEFVVVDAADGLRRPAFDHERLAALLSAYLGAPVRADALPVNDIELLDEEGARFLAQTTQGVLDCDLASGEVTPSGRQSPRHDQIVSPDGRRSIIAKGGDLYVRSNDGADRRLTQEGEPYFGFGKSPEFNTYTVALAMRDLPPPVIGVWSPDRRRFFTHRLDERRIGDHHLLQTVRPDGNLRPRLYSFRLQLAGEAEAALWEPVVIDVETASLTWGDIPAQEINDHTPEEWLRVWWSPDGRRVRFVTASRDKTRLTLSEMDASTGAVRTLLEQTSDSYQMLTPGTPRVGNEGRPNVRFLDGSQEFIWYDDTQEVGRLYLHDLKTGARKNAITKADQMVRDIIRVDEQSRRIWFTASGDQPGRDPYYRSLYAVNFDGSGLRLLTPEDAEHNIYVFPPVGGHVLSAPSGMAPSGRYFVDTYGRIDKPPVSVLRSAEDGRMISVLETAGIDRLEALGWRWPERFKVKAADGETDLYGVTWKPSWHKAGEKLPVIMIVYPGPQITLTPKTSFKSTWREFFGAAFCQSLAELGFIVVTVDPRGTALRDRRFRLVSYGDLGGVRQHEDYIATLRQLAERDGDIDLDRVGIHGHSGGGYSTARAMLTFPDFFKVGVASAGDHDLRGVLAMWAEAFHGPQDRHSWERLDSAQFAGNLKGKLLLAYSDMDECVHYGLTLRLVDALIKENKDFDLLVIPNAGHDFAVTSHYFLRRLWDYFSVHLAGREPPREFLFPS